MYDEVLFGPAPEAAVTVTHHAIRALLLSDEGKKFLSLGQEDDSGSVTFCDEFVKKIVGSVSPIIPIALRNKALDGCYLRTALNLIGCAEFLFSQYQNDIRDQANPNGLVGLSTGMHTEIKQSAVFGTELPPLEVFMKDMRVQYQTSLGLGPGRRSLRTQFREKGVVFFAKAVIEVGISCVLRRRAVASILRTPRTIRGPLFSLLLGGGAWRTLAPCAIRGYVLLTRMEIAAEDVPAGSGILTSLDERRRVFS